MQPKQFAKTEKRLSNPEYGQYLYEKYKVQFSNSDLCFNFNGKSYPKAEPLLRLLHKIEKTETNLNFYVFTIFIALLGLAIYGVNAIDVYVQSFRSL
jgi:hypothetical protein